MDTRSSSSMKTGADSANLDQYHAVVLANVYRLAEQTIESLSRFVRAGGGLMIFTGDQVDPEQFNASFVRDGHGLSPASLTGVVRPAEPVRLVIQDRLHPALEAVGRHGDPLGLGQIPSLLSTAVPSPRTSIRQTRLTVVRRPAAAPTHPRQTAIAASRTFWRNLMIPRQAPRLSKGFLISACC